MPVLGAVAPLGGKGVR